MLTDGQKKEAQDLFSKGYTTAQVFRHFGAQSIGQDSEIAIEESAIAKAETTPAFKPLSKKITGVLGLDSATQTFGDIIARTRLGAKMTGTNVEANREFIEAPTGKEIGGAVLKTAVTAASPAVLPIGMVPSMVAGAGAGFGREVGQNLMDDKQGAGILQPGMETVIGAAVPPVFKGLGRVLGGPSVAATADDLIKMKAGDAARDAAEATMPDYKIDYSRLTNKLKERATGIATAPKSATEAVGEVLQGQTDDVAKGMKAFRQIDTKDVKTYADLDGKIKESITRLSKEVDAELAKDTTVTPLSELASTVTSKGGNKVSTNYVQTSLQQLDELYTTTGDLAAKADLDMLISKANTQGLTKLEVNDLSRIYNQEFGSKAFSKMGDPLTSVNAQMYENVRKGLKDKAREGIGGATAKALDSDISALYNTQKLVQKNVEKVNQLKQKIQDRGLLEKMGHGLTKGIDLVTGGTIRGLVGGLLPRGAGYKVMNALDLEERLAKNLLMIDDALKAGTDDALIKAMKEVQKTTPELLTTPTPTKLETQ